MDQETVDAYLDEVEKIDPDMAAEMDGLVNGPSPSVKLHQHLSKTTPGYAHADTNSISIDPSMDLSDGAVALMHEWTHLRSRKGYGDCDPKTNAEENDLCYHSKLLFKELEWWCAGAELWFNENELDAITGVAFSSFSCGRAQKIYGFYKGAHNKCHEGQDPFPEALDRACDCPPGTSD